VGLGDVGTEADVDALTVDEAAVGDTTGALDAVPEHPATAVVSTSARSTRGRTPGTTVMT
jgi:hypothetical protein